MIILLCFSMMDRTIMSSAFLALDLTFPDKFGIVYLLEGSSFRSKDLASSQKQRDGMYKIDNFFMRTCDLKDLRTQRLFSLHNDKMRTSYYSFAHALEKMRTEELQCTLQRFQSGLLISVVSINELTRTHLCKCRPNHDGRKRQSQHPKHRTN